MSRKFLTPIDLSKNELQNARIQNLASAPSSPVTGQIYYDTALQGLYIYNGTAWALAGGISAGTLSSRPLATAVAAGTFYYATDNYLVYYSNGTTWQQINNFGSITTETSYGQSSSNGTSTNYARADHTHGTPPLSTNAATNITSTSSANGSGTAPAKDDHVHGFTPANFALSSFGAPTSTVSFNSQKISNLLDPTSAQDAATKNYVDAATTGLNVHDQVTAATTTNLVATYTSGTTGTDGGTGVGATLTITATGATTIDGRTLVLNDRVLVKNQTTALQNGIYTVTTAGTTGVSTVLTRSTDADNHISGQVIAGDFVFVQFGGQGSTGWVETATGTSTTPPNGIKLGTDSLTFSQFSGAGTYTAGTGLTLSGTTFAIDTTNGYGVRKYSANVGDGSSTSITITHNLGTRDVQVTLYDASSYAEVMSDVSHATTNTVTLAFSSAPTSNQYRVVIIG